MGITRTTEGQSAAPDTTGHPPPRAGPQRLPAAEAIPAGDATAFPRRMFTDKGARA